MLRRLSPLCTVLTLGLLVSALPSAAAVVVISGCPAPPGIINATIAAASPGDTIVIHPCTYWENVSIPAGRDDLHLVAAESPTLVGAVAVGVAAGPSAPRPTIVGSFPGGGACLEVDSPGVSIQGLALLQCDDQGVLATNNADHLDLHDVQINGTQGHGIELLGGIGHRITGNWISSVQLDGIRLENTIHSLVADNTVNAAFGPSSTGIRITSGTERVLVQRNEVRKNRLSGIHDESAFRSRIERNSSKDNCWGPGIVMCGCHEVLAGAASNGADLTGNDTAGAGVDASCAVSPDMAENF